MGSYAAGRVVAIATKLNRDSDEQIAARFCVPSIGCDRGRDGESRGRRRCRCSRAPRASPGSVSSCARVVDFYETYEFFHLQYKHGLKVLFPTVRRNIAARDDRRAQDRCHRSAVRSEQ